MRPADLEGFGPVNTNTPQTDEDIMRDVYMTRSQREAYERIRNRSIERDALAARVAELERAAKRFLDAGDNTMQTDDSVAEMIEFAQSQDSLRALLTKDTP